jgi:hypothetical protein
MRSKRLTSALPVLLLTVALISGCGSSSGSSSTSSTASAAKTPAAPATNGLASETAATILAATKAAADSATSVHVAGSIVNGGSSVTLDMSLLAGKGGRGRISQNKLGFELIVTGGTVYINGSQAFYRHIGGAAAAQLFQGKWLKAPAGGKDFGSVSSLTDLHKLVDTTLTSHGTLAKGAPTTVNGQQVVTIKDTSKGGILYIAATGKPYPVEVKKDDTSGAITFDRWNAPVSISAPANAVDIAQLQAAHH